MKPVLQLNMNFKVAFVVLCVLGVSFVKGLYDETSVQEFLRETVVSDTNGNISISESLMGTWYRSEANPGLKFAPGIVSQACLECICLTESGCQPLPCRMDVGSLSCGYFQIKEAYWNDCNISGTTWKECALDKECSSLCVQNYMKRYAKWAHCPLQCEGFAREHNGGPKGCQNPNTIPYWKRLQKIKGCKNVK